MVGFLLLMVPYLLQVVNEPPGYKETGFIAGGSDYATFITKMKWGMDGHWTYENRYTTEETTPVTLYHFYLFLGHLADWLGIQLPWLYHLARCTFSVLSALYLWSILKRHVPYNTAIAFILTVMASGGYMEASDTILGTNFNSDNSDLFLQGRVWLSFITYPHYSFELLGVLMLLDSYLSARTWLALPAGIIISLVHPFLLAVYCPAMLLSSIFRKDIKQAFISCALVTLGALPVMVPLYVVMQKTEWLKIWREQTYRPTPHLIKFFILNYGLVGVLGWFGMIKWLKNRDKDIAIWVSWIITAMVLSYLAPLPNKREFSFFISIPLGILATPYIHRGVLWFRENSEGIKKKVGPALLIVTCVWQGTAVYFDCLASFYLKASNGYYITPEYQQAFNIIDERGPDRYVLSPYWVGNIIPANTSSKPYIGHNSETQNFKEKKKVVDAFFNGELPSEDMQKVIRENKISWIIYDLPPGKDHSKLLDKLWEPVIRGDEMILWKVD